MPREGMNWWHVIISTRNSWLPGDKRGFRSKNHKIHSSGDYKKPPPIEEHSGLRRYHQERAGDVIRFSDDAKKIVGLAIINKLTKEGFQILALAVATTHSHWLVELPSDEKKVRRIAGECKTIASHAVRLELPGRVWAAGGKFIPIKDRPHQQNVFHYILGQKDAWTWDFRKDKEAPEAPR